MGIDSPIVAGVSFGGWVALEYALQFPEHAKGIMLCNSEAKIDKEVRKMAYGRKAKLLGDEPKPIMESVQRILISRRKLLRLFAHSMRHGNGLTAVESGLDHVSAYWWGDVAASVIAGCIKGI